MPIATTDDQRAAAEALRSWAAAARPIPLVRAQETDAGRWRECWPGLCEFGLFAVAVPAERGGLGGSVTDLAVLIEEAAAQLVPGPVLTTALAALLLSRGTGPRIDHVLAEIADGTRPAAVALSAGTIVASPSGQEAGGYLLTGQVGPVLGADPGAALVVAARAGDQDLWVLLEASAEGVKIADAEPGDFSRSMATVHLSGVHVTSEQVLSGIDTAQVRDLAATLAAAEAVGVAGWALRTAVDYAKVREQFGKPIGSFQAIKHLCAEMLCRTELATAVAWDAAEAAADDRQRPVAAAAAAAIALEVAVENAKDCIQVLGGIGFTWEHDAHLYLRRALALRALLGGSPAWRRRVAELTLSGERRELHVDLGDVTEFRAGVRETVEAISALPADDRRAALVDAGYLTPHWPRPHGLDASPVEQVVIDQELDRAGVTRPDLVIAGWAVPTILQHGTPAQIERFVRPTLLGELVWCQLFSEPGAGSDLAALRTRAERASGGPPGSGNGGTPGSGNGGTPGSKGVAAGGVAAGGVAAGGGGWRLSGQKVWTSVAQRADWAICLARTNSDAPKHKGISYFLVDMRSAGIDVRPLREITGEAVFNEVFLDDVFVPDEMLVGDVDDGWKLARTTLVNERLAMGGGSSIGDAVEQLLALATDRAVTSDDGVREQLGALIADGLAGSLLELRSTLCRLAGRDASAESSVRKLVGVRHRQAVAEAALDVLGADGALDGEQLRQFLLTRCLTIAGGTSQVLLTLAGERILGLPRG